MSQPRWSSSLSGRAAFQQFGPLAPAIEARLHSWAAAGIAVRIWARDPSVWSNVPAPELADRLGWLDLPGSMGEAIVDIERFADRVAADGMTDAVLLGMGGSSLAPELFQATFGNAPGRPQLVVLDSTHPTAVRNTRARIQPTRTLVIVSSKSGTTVETQSGLAYFWRELADAGIEPGRQVVAITDPGTPLELLARNRGFRAIWPAPPDVGGRYSALSVFGLVPAATIGAPVGRVLESARDMVAACGPDVAPGNSPALRLGAALGECAMAGRDKLVIVASPSLSALPAWLEQLIAESTGKNGRGIVPVADEPFEQAVADAADRVLVTLVVEGEESLLPGGWAAAPPAWPTIRVVLPSPAAIGAEFFRWELAVASAGIVLGVQPFDQPDVQLAKDLARRAMARSSQPTGGGPAAEVRVADAQALSQLAGWLATGRPGDYVAIQAFLPACSAPIASALADLRQALRRRLGVATTLGYGPRFLHSTGQLHKGGPDSALCLQLIDEPDQDLEVPDAGHTFGQLVKAQALGDFDAMMQRKRRVCRVNLGADAAAGLLELVRLIRWPTLGNRPSGGGQRRA